MTKNNTALVTGGSKRLGKAIVLKLAQMGYDIALHYSSSQESALQTANEVRQKGMACELFKADLSKEEELKTLISKTLDKFSNLRILVNSASIFKSAKIKETEFDLFVKHFAINLKAPFFLSKFFTAQVKQGQIINLLDTNIVQNKNSHAAYLLTKKALAEFTSMAAIEFAPQFRVNGIAPGLILPPADKDEAYLNNLSKKIPLQRKGDADKITAALQFLVQHDYLTGQVIFVDGGMHLQ